MLWRDIKMEKWSGGAVSADPKRTFQPF